MLLNPASPKKLLVALRRHGALKSAGAGLCVADDIVGMIGRLNLSRKTLSESENGRTLSLAILLGAASVFHSVVGKGHNMAEPGARRSEC